MENAVVRPQAGVVSIELVVEDLDRSLELLTGVLGLELLWRGPSALVTGEMATVDAGGCLLTLLEPASSGEGTILAERTPRLSQLVVGASPADVVRLHEAAVTAGLACAPSGRGFFVTPESAVGALGQPVAVVVTPVEEGG